MLTCLSPYKVLAKAKPEENHEPSKTDQAGYIPMQRRIQDLLDAGMRLKEYRAEQFDRPPGVDYEDIPIDPLRKPGIDPIDIEERAIEVYDAITSAIQPVPEEEKTPPVAEVTEIKAAD